MADELMVFGRDTVVFLYPIPSPITYTDGDGATMTVVATPLPTEGPLLDMLTPAEKVSIAAGDLAFEIIHVMIDPALTPAENLAAVRTVYADKMAAFLTDYQARWDRYGQRFDA